MMPFTGAAVYIGTLIADVELKFSQSGKAFAKATIVVKNKKQDGTESAYFVDITAFDKLAENAAASLQKGDTVFVFGEHDPQQWESKKEEGKIDRKLGVLAAEFSPSLRWNACEMLRTERSAAPAKPRQAELSEDEEPF